MAWASGPARAAAPSAAQAVPVASYTLAAELDPTSHRITAAGSLRWRNRTTHPASELRFHLYLNAFKNTDSSFLAEGRDAATLAEHGWGWIEVQSLREPAGPELADRLEPVLTEDGRPGDETVARLPLARPVPPGGELRLEMRFVAQLPFVVARTGFKNDFHLVAQWFPKLGVLEEDGSWTCPQLHRTSEFFADFGDYDVTLTVPARFVVGATGQLADEQPAAGGRRSYRYVQNAVHDFAWTAWPSFVSFQQTFREPGLPAVEVRLLLRPETARYAPRTFAAVAAGLSRFGRWYGPYPYPTLTVVDPPWGADAAGGMEYPTFITTGAQVLSPLATWDPEEVTIHELGHQFWYGLVATDEFRESFLDEGINTYATARVLRDAYPPKRWVPRLWGVPIVFRDIVLAAPLDTAARFFRRGGADPIARTSWGYLDSNAYRAQTYSKMALLMEQIERTVGRERMEAAMRAYAKRFRYRHPRTRDLVHTLCAVTGVDLHPQFSQLLAGNEVLDYRVESLRCKAAKGPVGLFGDGDGRHRQEEGKRLAGAECTVVVRRAGGVRLPVVTELRFADGRRERRTWDGRDSWVRYRTTGPEVAVAVVDPDEVLVLDQDRLNNSRRLDPDARASRRWSQRLRFWIQNLLETFATFG